MFWLLGLIAVGAAIILDDEAEQSRKEWEDKYHKVDRTVKKHNENIKAHLVNAQNSYDFHLLRNLYISSIKGADEAYELLSNARKYLNGIGQALLDIKNRIVQLKEKRKSKTLSKEERVAIQREISELYELRKALFQDKEKVEQERDHLMKEVRRLNQETHKLKEAIREHCGYGGRVWYERLERRKALKH